MSLLVDIEKELQDFRLNVSFSVEDGEGITGILGASGCGKSMTLKCIAGIVRPDRGRIVLNGRTLFDSDRGIDLKIQDRRVGYLFQSYALFPNMTVQENVEMAVSGTRDEKRERAGQYLRMFRAEELAKKYPSRLSGGQQQRAALARIMASEPDVLMLDEPFSALDYYLKEKLQLELTEELKGFSGEVLLVTHSRDEIYRLCSRIHVLDQGNITVSGAVKAVFREPRVVAAARLTGCKNVERVERIDGHTFDVPGWGVRFRIRGEVPEEAGYIGIRAHCLKAAPAGGRGTVLDCRCARILEDPFEVTLILENGIWWKIPKERWTWEFHEKVPKRVLIPEESIFFLRETKEDGGAR